jgi:hypothetical protein
MEAMLPMKKIDMAALRRAHDEANVMASRST